MSQLMSRVSDKVLGKYENFAYVHVAVIGIIQEQKKHRILGCGALGEYG